MRRSGLSIVGLILSSVIACTGCVTVVPAQGAAAAAAPTAPTAPAASTASAAPAKQHEASTASASPKEDTRHIYRLEFMLTPGDGASPTAYTMNLSEGDMGAVHTGTNVMLQPNPPPPPKGAPGPLGGLGIARMDVGTSLKADYRNLGDDLMLHASTEISSIDDGKIDKLSANGDALVTPGKPTVIESISDGNGKKKYELSVTATKLR